jgi:transposase
MSKQLHNRFSDEQVRAILNKYAEGELSASQAQDMLGLSRSQFFEWVKRHKEGGQKFSVGYSRTGHNHRIGDDLEKAMLKELKVEKALIDNPSMPVRGYNYSFIRDQLKKKHKRNVSLPTIIDRAKKGAFTRNGLPRRFTIGKS